MKRGWYLLCLAMVMGFVLGQPLLVLAQEHAGKEHAGGETTAPAPAAADDEKATLTQASSALEATDPALAVDLKAWAEGTGVGDMNATLMKAADALEITNPDLAKKVRDLVTKEPAGGEATT